MKQGFNLSARALKQQQLMAFLMLLIMATGIISYEQLSRNEDPAFTIKTAVVSAQWPGANLSDTVNLVTDTLEKKLQEIPWLDYVQSETHAGRCVIFINLRDSTPPDQVADIWYRYGRRCRTLLLHYLRAYRGLWSTTNLKTLLVRFTGLLPTDLLCGNCGIGWTASAGI